MRLATIDNGTRDGRLILVNHDGSRGVYASGIHKKAITFQNALDEWADISPVLEKAAADFDNQVDSFPLSEQKILAPLPRAYQWVDGSAFLHHMKLVRQARGATMPPSFLHDPLVYQGGSDTFLAHNDDILHYSEDFGIDFEAELGVITDDVPMGTSAEDALKHIKLIVLLNDVSLRNLIPGELAKNFGFYQSKPPTAFAPFAITPDELGRDFRDGRIHRRVEVAWNGEFFGKPNAGLGMQFGFHELIAHVTKTRPLGAGTIIGSGTISNDEEGVGSCCIAEKRMLEIIANKEASTSFMRFGDRLQIEVFDDAGRSLFGRIQQTVKEAK